jgi:exodeoxyribonuclease V alpha subunit
MEPSRTATQRPLLPPGAAMQPGTVTLEGVLELVSYANPETGWTVVKLTLPGRPDLVTAVGSLSGVQPGESLRLTGRWAPVD